MADDIVETLRYPLVEDLGDGPRLPEVYTRELMRQAAAEIERLRSKLRYVGIFDGARPACGPNSASAGHHQAPMCG